MNEVFKKKYLKYSPEITLEVFTLVCNKLIESGLNVNHSIEWHYDKFKGHYQYLLIPDGRNDFSAWACNSNRKEITVQEILGYDPFANKEVIPEYVECIEVATCNTKVGEIFKCRHSNGFFEWEYNNKSKPNYNSWDGWDKRQWSDSLVQIKFKPSTKEAYNLQQLSKSIEKWSVGSYVVCIERYTEKFKVGDIGEIEGSDYRWINISKSVGHPCLPDKIRCKWFATKSEAEEFAKTLIDPIKDVIECETCNGEGYVMTAKLYPTGHTEVVETCPDCNGDGFIDKPKQLLKQAVHCTTQKEWDFVLSKLPKSCLLYKQNDKFEEYNNNYKHENGIAVDVEDCAYCGIGWYKNNNYQILSFQEWCDLNGYKMESPDKIKSNDFKVGDYVVITKSSKNWVYEMDVEVGKVVQITDISDTSYINYEGKPNWSFGARDGHFRHATLEEINNHLISIGQIPAGEPLNTGIEPNKDGMFKYTTYAGTTYVGKTSTIPESLNNYIMDKKMYTIKELETNPKLLIYINSVEEYNKIEKVSKRICSYLGNYCYSLYKVTYSSSSTMSYHGEYDKDSIILTIYDIIFEDNIKNDDKEISDESYIGKYVSFKYHNYFYDKAFIIKENDCIYLLNNCYPNNDGHKDKSKYKYSLKFTLIEVMLKYCENIKFLDFESPKFKPLCPDDLEWEIQVPQIKTHGIMWCEPAPMTKDNWKPKMILSIDDEELPMVSIIKTNTIKQLLNIE